MGPGAFCKPVGVTGEAGVTGVPGEVTGLPGGVFPDAAPRRLHVPNSPESFLPNTFLLDLE